MTTTTKTKAEAQKAFTKYALDKILLERHERMLKDVVDFIAKEHLHVETLEVQGRDSLDFHDLHVANIRKALEAAFEAGRLSK